MELLDLLLDLDRWDRADDAAQDLEIAEVARRLHPEFAWLRTHRFTTSQQRIRRETCTSCQGWGGASAQSGSDYPDCSTCNNDHVIEHPYHSDPTSHRIAVFRHRPTAQDFALVPGRLEVAACLVAIAPHVDTVPAKLRLLSASEDRHACRRGGAFDLAWEDGTWSTHPLGLVGVAPTIPRLAASVPGLEIAQVEAFHALADELGPIDPAAPPGCLACTGDGTADPQGEATALAWSPDDRWIAVGSVGEIRVSDARTGRQLSRLALSKHERSAKVETIAFSPDGLRLVAATQEDVEIFEVATGEALVRLGRRILPTQSDRYYSEYRAATWLPDGRILVAEASAQTSKVLVSLVDPEAVETVRSSEWRFDGFLWGLSLAASPDGTLACVSLRDDGALAIWDIARWAIVKRIPVNPSVAVALGGGHVFLNSDDKARAHSLATGERTELGPSALSRIAATHDGQRVAWPHGAGIGVFDMRSRTMHAIARETRPPFAFSFDGTRIATGVTGHPFAAIWSAVVAD